MKLLKKIALWIGGFVATVLLAFIALVIYIKYIDVCDPYQTTFLGKTIKFPMNLNEATQYYHLQTDGTVAWSFSERDTLQVVDTYGNSKNVNTVVFYLRDLPIDNITQIKASLEKQYGKKFIYDPIFSGISYIKITDCVFLQICTSGFREDYLAAAFIKPPPVSFGKKRVTCSVSFWYHVSEGTVSGRSTEGGFSYIIAPYHLPH